MRARMHAGSATTAAVTRSPGIERLRDDPGTRSATITTFEPHTDTATSRASLLDFGACPARSS